MNEHEAIKFLTENGMPPQDIQHAQNLGISIPTLVDAAKDILNRGGFLSDWDFDVDQPLGGTFGPFDPFEPPDTSRLPPFPVDSLPPVLRGMAKEAANNLQVPVDMTAVAGLAVAALCAQGRFVISPKPGWLEQLNLYAVIVARPSERKSPALDVMVRPLHRFEQEENERRAPYVEEFRTRRELLSKKIANLKELVAKPIPSKGKTTVELDDITELQRQLAELEKNSIKPLRLLADDTTPEALISLMAENDGRMGIVSDEGGVFDVIGGRYSDGKANMDVFLKGYTGTYLRVDRKGRPGEAIPHPTLTMLLMVQPSVLEAIMGNKDFSGRGLLSRPLYSIPVSTVGRRAYHTPPISARTEAAYNDMLEGLLSIPETGETRVIHLSPEADKEAEQFFNILEQRLTDDLEDLEDWAGKLHGQTMRIAGVIHCCLYGQSAAENPVTLSTMRAAQTIGGYFLEHARAAFRMMGMAESQAVRDAKYILRRLGDQSEISKRDLYHLCKGRLNTVENMEHGLSELVRRGYIAIESQQTGGRPTEKIKVNPLYQKDQKPQKSA